MPDLQREFSYTTRQMSQVVLSMLRGLSIDAVSLVCQNADHTKYAICDGGHRIVTLRRFFAGEFALDYPRSEGSDAISIKGCRFADLSAYDQQRIAMMPLQCVIVYPGAFDKASLRAAELAVFRAKNSCAIRMGKAALCCVAISASYEEIAEARAWYKRMLKATGRAVGLSEKASALLCNMASTTAALLVAACVLTKEGLLGALTEVVLGGVIETVSRSLAEGYIPRLTSGCGNMTNLSGLSREISLAFLREVIPGLHNRTMCELRALYKIQRSHSAFVSMRFIVESVCGKQDWSLLRGTSVL